jgi:hypothetical protein
MTCPRCDSILVCGECLTCAFEEKERIDRRLGHHHLPVKVNMRWPPVANENGERHTHPMLWGERGEDED